VPATPSARRSVSVVILGITRHEIAGNDLDVDPDSGEIFQACHSCGCP